MEGKIKCLHALHKFNLFFYFNTRSLCAAKEIFVEKKKLLSFFGRNNEKVTNSIYNNKRRRKSASEGRDLRHASLFNNMTMRSLNLPESFNL